MGGKTKGIMGATILATAVLTGVNEACSDNEIISPEEKFDTIKREYLQTEQENSIATGLFRKQFSLEPVSPKKEWQFTFGKTILQYDKRAHIKFNAPLLLSWTNGILCISNWGVTCKCRTPGDASEVEKCIISVFSQYYHDNDVDSKDKNAVWKKILENIDYQLFTHGMQAAVYHTGKVEVFNTDKIRINWGTDEDPDRETILCPASKGFIAGQINKGDWFIGKVTRDENDDFLYIEDVRRKEPTDEQDFTWDDIPVFPG